MKQESLALEDVQTVDKIEARTISKNMMQVKITNNGETTKQILKPTLKNELIFNKEKYNLNGKSLYDILFGNSNKRVQINESPDAFVQPGPFEDTYRLWYKKPYDSALTTSDQSLEVLRAIKDCIQDDDLSEFKDLYDSIKEEYVNRDLFMQVADELFEDSSRVESTERGIVVDDILLVTWDAELHLNTERWQKGTFSPYGQNYDKPKELRTLEFEEKSSFKLELGNAVYELDNDDWVFFRKLVYAKNWEDNLLRTEVETLKGTMPLIKYVEENYEDLL